jgi:hypothetical protein
MSEKKEKKIEVNPDFVLTIIHEFEDYKRGQKITDAKEIKKLLESEHAHCFVKSEF